MIWLLVVWLLLSAAVLTTWNLCRWWTRRVEDRAWDEWLREAGGDAFGPGGEPRRRFLSDRRTKESF